MRIVREIIETPWFYWPFGVVCVLLLVNTLGRGASPGEALATALSTAFFLAFTISGVRRVYRRLRDRWP